MIKIQEHLNRDDADTYLDSCALKLWDFYNKKLDDNSDYRHFSLIKRLDRLILESDQQKYLTDIANNDIKVLERHKLFYKYLKDDNYAKLKSLIISRPEKLVLLRGEIFEILELTDLYVKNGQIKQTSFSEILIDKIFIYKNYRSSQICTELLNEMNLQNTHCPYCNYNKVSVVPITAEDPQDKKDKAYLDIDHFYPKAQYPYFALSFYNLIPSCHTCNSSEKGNIEFSIQTHTNPYHKSYNASHKFVIDSDFFVKGRTNDLYLENKAQQTDLMDKDLRLSDRYKLIYLKNINSLINQYIDYQHYRNSPDYHKDYSDALLQKVPKKDNEILKYDGGKMFRDILKKIDVFGLIN